MKTVKSHFVAISYFVLSVFVILGLAQMTQKPLCINSHVIEKLTMVDDSVVYRCSIRKKVPYSMQFVRLQNLINSKVLPFEIWMNQIWNIKPSRVSVKLLHQPIVTQTQGETILLWDQNLINGLQLEIEIVKRFLKKLNPSFFENNQLALSSLAEFIIKIWSENQTMSYGGLSTYVAHQWWDAFDKMKSQEKYTLLKKIPEIIKNSTSMRFNDSETKDYEQILQLVRLFSAESRFYSLFKSKNSYEENSLTASFDYLILMPKIQSGTLTSLNHIQNREPTLSFGAWDGKSLYHIGSKSQISTSSFNRLKVNHLIWESCDDLELRAVLGVSAEVRKLLVVRNCSSQNHLDYFQYVKRGVAGFAATHPQVSFVQLDLPSLNMRKDEIILQQKIFELMTLQNQNAFLRLFGLQQLNWDSKLQIYIPKLNIDAVESFRVLKIN